VFQVSVLVLLDFGVAASEGFLPVAMPKPSEEESRELSPRQAKELDVEIGFLEGLVRRDPGYVDALQILGDSYTRRGRYHEGLSIDLQLSRLRPDDALVQYNLACSCALTNQPEAAVLALHRALDLGYRDFDWLKKDPDLQGLRQHPLFKSVSVRVRELRGA
jgi:tetratricopeptide (TPR) repeat protein